jgi:hypothetical protein
VDAAAAGLRLLLRQAALRPAGPRERRAVRGHLAAGRDYQDKLIRFIENHDEPRAATALPGGRDRAAAVAVATLPGATLWHDGEFEGRRTHLPVFLARFPDEPVDEDLRAFYRRLLAVVAGMRRGDWTMVDATAGRTTRPTPTSCPGPGTTTCRTT